MGYTLSRKYLSDNYHRRGGYWNCGYGCQWYDYDPGCTPCDPSNGEFTSDSIIAHTAWILLNYYVTVADDTNTDRCPSEDQITRIPAVLRSFTISSTLRTSLGGYAEIIQDSNDLSNTFLTQTTGHTNDSITLSLQGIDTDNDGYGDLTISQRNRTLWFKKNDDANWIMMSNVVLFRDDYVYQTYYTLYSLDTPYIILNDGDEVDIEIR